MPLHRTGTASIPDAVGRDRGSVAAYATCRFAAASSFPAARRKRHATPFTADEQAKRRTTPSPRPVRRASMPAPTALSSSSRRAVCLARIVSGPSGSTTASEAAATATSAVDGVRAGMVRLAAMAASQAALISRSFSDLRTPILLRSLGHSPGGQRAESFHVTGLGGMVVAFAGQPVGCASCLVPRSSMC